jgi:hypothetical protein
LRTSFQMTSILTFFIILIFIKTIFFALSVSQQTYCCIIS